MTQLGKATDFNDILIGFERALQLEAIADLGRKPSLEPVSIVACFADIRGFTKLVKKDQERGQNVASEFLREFFSIFPRAVLRERWNLEPDNPQQAHEFQESVRRLIIPKLAKKLGDGVLLVWELDRNTSKEINKGLRYAILDIVGYIQEYFYDLLHDTHLDHSQLLSELKIDIGIGVAGGEAWRHDYGGQNIDYSGTPLNLAARLQDRARPKGVCVHSDFETRYLLERFWADEGKIRTEEIVGLGDVSFWFTKESLRLRRPRKEGISLSALKLLVKNGPFVERSEDGAHEVGRLSLSPGDVETLLDLREKKEASFARGAAKLSDSTSSPSLMKLIDEMDRLTRKANKRKLNGAEAFRKLGQIFHETIASLASRNKKKSKENSDLVRLLHEWTTNNKNYPKATGDLRKMYEEHLAIAHAIVNQSPEIASRNMHIHLSEHHKRVEKKAFGSSTARSY